MNKLIQDSFSRAIARICAILSKTEKSKSHSRMITAWRSDRLIITKNMERDK